MTQPGSHLKCVEQPRLQTLVNSTRIYPGRSHCVMLDQTILYLFVLRQDTIAMNSADIVHGIVLFILTVYIHSLYTYGTIKYNEHKRSGRKYTICIGTSTLMGTYHHQLTSLAHMLWGP